MSKYLDIARKFEAERKAKQASESQQSAPSVRDRYRQAAESVREECFAIDPVWLIEHKPQLWQRMVLLDRQIDRLEREGAEVDEIEATLERLVQVIRVARAAYEREHRQETSEVIQ